MSDYQVNVINVGHGDCIVVRIASGGELFSLLIDGGKPGSGALDKIREMDLLPKKLGKPGVDLLVATHHDRDHLGGLVEIVEQDALAIGRAWAPVVFKPTFDLWSAGSVDRTFTEEALVDSDRAQDDALRSMERALGRMVQMHEGGFQVARPWAEQLNTVRAEELVALLHSAPPFRRKPEGATEAVSWEDELGTTGELPSLAVPH